jgi:hypothetical protein
MLVVGAESVGADRGAGGNLKVLMWQGPTILNPHLSQGTKDNIAARFCCEPLSLRPSEAEPEKFDKLILRLPNCSQPVSLRRIRNSGAVNKKRILRRAYS